MHPRQNQISTVIHHQLQILRFLLLVPSDPLIAWGHLPSRRRPQQTGQYLLSTPPVVDRADRAVSLLDLPRADRSKSPLPGALPAEWRAGTGLSVVVFSGLEDGPTRSVDRMEPGAESAESAIGGE